MKKTLASLAFGAVPFLAGCGTTLDSSAFLREHSLENVKSSRDARYSIDTVAMGGIEYFAKNNEVVGFDEADFVLVPYKGSLLSQDLGNKKIDVISDKIVVPVKYTPNPEKKFDFADEIRFKVDGPYQVKAEIKPRADELLGVRTITHEDLSVYVKTISVGQKGEFYVGLTFEEATKEKPIPSVKETYIMPRTGSTLSVNTKTGQIIATNPDQVYILKEMPMNEYLHQRELFAMQKRAVIEAQKQAEEINEKFKKTHGQVPAIETPQALPEKK